MKYLLIVEGDVNDADYITQETALDQVEFEALLPLLTKVGAAIAANNGTWNTLGVSHYPTVAEMYGSVLTEDEIAQFDEMTPHGEFGGVHSINGIHAYQVV